MADRELFQTQPSQVKRAKSVPDRAPVRWWLCWLVYVSATACSAPRLPPPEVAARQYTAAVEAGDAEALWAMMSDSGRLALSKQQVQQSLEENRAELRARAHSLRTEAMPTRGRAILYLEQGNSVELNLEEGRFKVVYDQIVSAPTDSPSKALLALRTALTNRNYQELLKVLDPQLRDLIDHSLASLVLSLAEIENSSLDINNDRATATFPNGATISLQKLGDQWFVTELP